MTKDEIVARIALIDEEMKKAQQNINQLQANLTALFGGKSELEHWLKKFDDESKQESSNAESKDS